LRGAREEKIEHSAENNQDMAIILVMWVRAREVTIISYSVGDTLGEGRKENVPCDEDDGKWVSERITSF
jgi:hypothetical protein